MLVWDKGPREEGQHLASWVGAFCFIPLPEVGCLPSLQSQLASPPLCRTQAFFHVVFTTPWGRWYTQILQSWMPTWRHNERRQRSMHRGIKRENKIVPWYWETPHNVPRVCVVVLHRKCVLNFHGSRISG